MPNLEEGYIKLFRSSMDNPLYKNPLIWHLWEHLLLRANHEEKKIIWNGQEMVIKRGSLITGRKIISLETGISERTIRTGLATLHSLGMIEKSTSKSTSKFSYISICNYDRFQSWNRISDQQNDQQVTSNRPASDQQVTTNKNEKNVKNEKKINTLFDQFWKFYPKKIGLGAARKAWNKIKPLPSESLLKIMLDKIGVFKQSEQWRKESGQFIPNPATWLNEERWADEPPKEIGGVDYQLIKPDPEYDALLKSMGKSFEVIHERKPNG